MRPSGTTKGKLAIREDEYQVLMLKTKRDKSIQHSTKQKLLCAFTLLYHSGCRVDEIRLWTYKDINQIVGKGVFSLTNNTKTNKPRMIRFVPGSIEEIKKYANAKDGYLFKKNASDEAISQSGFTRMLNTQIHKVLGELYSSHSFRSGLTMQIIRTAGAAVAKAHMGHKDIKTTLIYDRVEEKDITNSLNKIF